MKRKKSIKRLLAHTHIVILCLILTILLLPFAAFANDDDRKKVKINIVFKNNNPWGGEGEEGQKRRQTYMNNLKAQLESEWGNDMKVKRKGKEETIKGIDIEVVSEGPYASADIDVIIHDMNECGPKGALGYHDARTRKSHVYPKSMKNKGYSKDPNDPYLIAWMVNVTAHEIGHYACANDSRPKGKLGPDSPLPDKMIWNSKYIKQWAEKQNHQRHSTRQSKNRSSVSMTA